MKRRPSTVVGLVAVLVACMLSPAHATFHLMQIEQVIAGVDGNASVQAIQLRMRADLQNFTSGARLRAVDATGANPVIIKDMLTDVANHGIGVRVLLATADFASNTVPAAVPDFILDNPIPASYLTAGCLSFEANAGTIVYWRLCWGGAGYSGPTTGNIVNDADGQFAPPYGSALPTGSGVALRFLGTATALSTNNAADYGLTSGAAVFTNNAGAMFTVQSVTGVPVLPGGPDFVVGEPRIFPNPFTTSTRVEMELGRPAAARLVIVDATGRRVRELAASLPVGAASFAWDGRNAAGAAVPSGIYFYRLEAGDAVKHGRMIRLR